MIRVPLRSRTGDIRAHALLDEIDAHLAERRWSLDPDGYARRCTQKHWKRLTLLLHREVMKLEAAMLIAGYTE